MVSETDDFLPQIVKAGGLNSHVGLIIIANSAFSGISLVINPFHVWKMYKRWWIAILGGKCTHTQKEANTYAS
jgi:hypothetical protein